MEIIAKSKFIRTSPRKLRLVARALKGLSPLAVMTQLEHLNKRAVGPLAKTFKSAMSNATANFNLRAEGLRVKKIEISQGPIYKRFQPVSRGRAHPIAKRTSHITVVLEGEK